MTRPHSILIAYGTSEGQTGKIAGVLAEALRNRGASVDVVEITSGSGDAVDFDYDAVVIGDSVHTGHHHRAVRQFIKHHRTELDNRPTAFFSVSLSRASDDHTEWEALNAISEKLFADCDWHPDIHESFAGALRYSQYGWFKKRIMARIAAAESGDTDTSHDYEYTDWRAVRGLAEHVIKAVETQP